MKWCILRLSWSPRSLGEAALRCSGAEALLVGLSVCCLEASILLWLRDIGIVEPWGTLASYVKTAIGWVLWSTCIMVVPAVVILGSIACAGLFTQPRRAAFTRLILLVPVPLFAPIVAWGFFVACREARGNIARGHPTWFDSSVVDVLGSAWWMYLFAALPVVYLIYGIKMIRKVQQNEMLLCNNCDYPIGTSPVCTECGAPIIRK